MYDVLLTHQDKLGLDDLAGYAEELGLDVDRFLDEIRRRQYAARVADDVATADESGVSGTPTFFINGRRHYGAYDIDALKLAVRAAKSRVALTNRTLSPAP
jgi:predicted DsbA family dithiol-disulfide isomerase